jgi:arylsulfatase A-like enzyme
VAELESPRLPDVLVILVDDWALSDLEAARRDANPWNDLLNVDALAAVGLSWNHFYSQPTCNPTRASLMLGTYRSGSSGGVCNPANASTPPADAPMLPALLQGEGYATAAFGKWHVSANPDRQGKWLQAPATYGFDTWRAWNASNVGGHCGSKHYWDWQRVDDGVATRSTLYHTKAVVEAAADWWQSTDGPRFAYVAFQAPHEPLHRPPGSLLPPGYPPVTTNREKYESMLVGLDTAVGTLLSIVDLRSTYVFLLGDNGTPPNAIRPGEQSGASVKRTTLEDGVNVPFVVAGPGVPVGETDALGHVVDFMATLGELAGADLPVGLDSVSLVPVLEDPAARVRDHVICDHRKLHKLSQTEVRDTGVVLAVENPPMLLKGRFYTDGFRGFDRRHYYDLTVDPEETLRLGRNDPFYREHLDRIEAIKEAFQAREP